MKPEWNIWDEWVSPDFLFHLFQTCQTENGGGEGGRGRGGGREGGEGGGRRNEDVDGFLCSLHGIVQLDLQALREPK